MNRMKGAFEEQFGDLAESKENVKHEVLQGMHRKKRSVKWQVPVAVAVLLVALVGFLLMQITKESEQTAVLSDEYFEVEFYKEYYLSYAFMTEKQARKITYENMLLQTANVKYAEHLGLEIDEQQLQEMATEQFELLEEMMAMEEVPWVRFTYETLFVKFDLTLESFMKLKKEHVFLPTVSNNALMKHFGNDQYEQIDEDALLFMEEHYAAALQRFKDKHNIDETYQVKREGEASELVTVNGAYETVIVDDVELFQDTFWTVDQILFDFEDVLTVIEERGDISLLCYATLDQYRAGAQKLLDDKEYGQQAKDLVRVVEVLENSVELD